jgi:hypothetical protein
MKKAILIPLVFTIASIAGAANVPSGVTGLWRFQNSANYGAATIGNDITFNTPYGTLFLGPWTDIGTESLHTLYSDGSVFQEQTYNWMIVNPGFTANGGGSYVNQYSVAIDYVQTQEGWNSLFQTAFDGNANDGDLFIAPGSAADTRTDSTIGIGDVGYSTPTFDASQWHRIVWSVDNGDDTGAGGFFRVYIDGTLFLDGAGQGRDGRFSLYPDRFNLFADNNGEDTWGLVGTVATWNRALTTDEVAGMGGWIGGSATPTPLIFSETTTNDIPIIVSVSPADGATNAAPNFAYQAIIADSSTAAVDKNSIQLLLDGAPVTPSVMSSVFSISVTFSSGGLLQSGSTHKYTLTFSANGVSSPFTNEVTFTAQNYTSYEWRFTNGDLTTDLGNGTLSYVAGPAGTTFGTTDGSAVPHINGTPAKFMHVPGFTLDSDGYWLVFNDSGPNVGTNASINRYTLLFDMLLPNLNAENAPEYIVPLFNTDPYNLDDADFYLRTNGSVGIGYGGYSAPDVIQSNVWFRLAFVADLATSTLTYYVNGTNVGSQSADGLRGRWSLYSNQDVGAYPKYPANLLLFNEGDTSGIYTHQLYLSSVAFADRALSAAELAALGGPSANGILVRSLESRPAMAIQASGGGATISWPTGYVGYALEQSDSLTAPQWKAVAGVTNNAANVVVGGSARFYRLVQ